MNDAVGRVLVDLRRAPRPRRRRRRASSPRSSRPAAARRSSRCNPDHPGRPRAAGGRAGHRRRRHRRRSASPTPAGCCRCPRLTRHATLALAFLDSQQWIKKALGRADRHHRHGPGVHRGQRAAARADPEPDGARAQRRGRRCSGCWEMRARRRGVAAPRARAVPAGRRGEPPGRSPRPGSGPARCPTARSSRYRGTLGPTALGAALGLLPLTFAPSRSADLLKALTPKAAVQGREAFAAVLDVRMCGRGVLPMDGSAYRRLDRVTPSSSTAPRCAPARRWSSRSASTRPRKADGWDAVALWTGASRLLGSEPGRRRTTPGRLRLGPAGADPDRPGARVHAVARQRDGEPVGTVVVTDELDPHAEALLRAVARGGPPARARPRTPGVADVAGLADEVAAAGGDPAGDRPPGAGPGPRGAPRRLGEGSVDLPGRDGAGAGAADAGPALLAADVAVAPVVPGRAPVVGRGPRHRARPRRRLPDRRRDRPPRAR